MSIHLLGRFCAIASRFIENCVFLNHQLPIVCSYVHVQCVQQRVQVAGNLCVCNLKRQKRLHYLYFNCNCLPFVGVLGRAGVCALVSFPECDSLAFRLASEQLCTVVTVAR